MPIHLPIDVTKQIPRPADSRTLYLHCPGGIRAAKVGNDTWLVEPFIRDSKPCYLGNFSQTKLQTFLEAANLVPMAEVHSSWHSGSYFSHWSPIFNGRVDPNRGPSDFWQSISSNLAKPRWSAVESTSLDFDTLKIYNDRTKEESLARSISLSLRSMDISVEKISDFYNEQLVNLLAAGKVSGQRISSAMDQTLCAHVHSFFLQFGSARDYLATFIALKLDLDVQKIDDMARLSSELSTSSFSTVPILQLMKDLDLLKPKPNAADKWKLGGWLEAASLLRKRLVHNRPFGLMFSENAGHLIPIDQEAGLFRYFRALHVETDAVRDVLDEIAFYYRKISELFHEAAQISGHDLSILEITGADIKSISISRGSAG